MMNLYPLKAVVTTNPVLASSYNDDPLSAYLTSGCLTPAEVTSLLEQGASFEALIFVDGAGEALATRLSTEMRLEKFSTDDMGAPSAVKRIHALLETQNSLFDIGG